MLFVKIKNLSPYPLPQNATQGASGVDLRAHLAAPVTLKSQERTLIPTGLYIEIPEGYEAQVRPRSGLALKKGLSLPNAPGTIDSDYRGEIGVIMINLSDSPQTIEPGDRIAQMVFACYEKVTWEETDEVKSTERGGGGFGSTGN